MLILAIIAVLVAAEFLAGESYARRHNGPYVGQYVKIDGKITFIKY